jgi:hypothetical protein
MTEKQERAATLAVSALPIRPAVRYRPASQSAVPPGSGSPEEGRRPGHRRRGRHEHGRRRQPGGTTSGIRLVLAASIPRPPPSQLPRTSTVGWPVPLSPLKDSPTMTDSRCRTCPSRQAYAA